MPLLMLKDIPQYECILEAAKHYPTLEPTAHEAFLHLLRTADLLNDNNQRFFARHNISQGRFTVMMLLHRPWVRVKTLASLAEDAGVTRATMTGLIDTLEKDGLVTRHPDLHDRRITHVELTDQGRAHLEAIFPECFGTMAHLMSPLSDPERKELVRLLQKIQGSLARQTEADPTGSPQGTRATETASHRPTS